MSTPTLRQRQTLHRTLHRNTPRVPQSHIETSWAYTRLHSRMKARGDRLGDVVVFVAAVVIAIWMLIPNPVDEAVARHEQVAKVQR